MSNFLLRYSNGKRLFEAVNNFTGTVPDTISNTELEDVTFSYCRLTGWDVNNVKFVESYFMSSYFERTSFADMSFTGCLFRRSNYNEPQFGGDGSKAPLTVFDTCNFSNVVFEDAQLVESIFKKTVISNTQFINCAVNDVEFDGCRLENVTFKDCDMKGTTFLGAYLENVTFDNCGEGPDFTGAVSRNTLPLTNLNEHGRICPVPVWPLWAKYCTLSERLSFFEHRPGFIDIQGMSPLTVWYPLEGLCLTVDIPVILATSNESIWSSENK